MSLIAQRMQYWHGEAKVPWGRKNCKVCGGKGKFHEFHFDGYDRNQKHTYICFKCYGAYLENQKRGFIVRDYGKNIFEIVEYDYDRRLWTMYRTDSGLAPQDSSSHLLRTHVFDELCALYNTHKERILEGSDERK